MKGLQRAQEANNIFSAKGTSNVTIFSNPIQDCSDDLIQR